MSNCRCDLFFKNFTNKTRLNIMLVLEKENLDVNSISEKLKLEQSLISHNLKKLMICNLINFKKLGKKRVYFLNKKIALPILKIYETHIQKHSCNKCKVIN